MADFDGKFVVRTGAHGEKLVQLPVEMHGDVKRYSIKTKETITVPAGSIVLVPNASVAGEL